MVPKVENIEIKEEIKKEFEPNQYRYETNSFTKFITQPRTDSDFLSLKNSA